MRISIYLEQDEQGEWKCGPDDPHLDVSHEKPLTDDEVQAFRELGSLAAKRLAALDAPLGREMKSRGV